MCKELKVIFLKCQGEVTAVFPSTIDNRNNTMTCYAHIGQHSLCNFLWYREAKKAVKEEYDTLLKELQGIYDDFKLVVVSRRTRFLLKGE